MSYQFYKRRWRSLKDSDIPGIFYGSPTWDDASAHWNGFVESESRCVNGEAFEFEIEPTWNTNGEWPDNGLYDGGRWFPRFTTGTGYQIEGETTWTACAWEELFLIDKTAVFSWNNPDDYLIRFFAGPGYSIPPTRTPWVSWWGWRANVSNKYFPRPNVIEFYVPYILPDVQKENPQ